VKSSGGSHSLDGHHSAAGSVVITVAVEERAESIAFAARGFEIELQMPSMVSEVREGILKQVQDVQSPAMAFDDVAGGR